VRTAGACPPARHEAIRQQARQYPDRLALVCGAQRLNYGELEARANQLANLLIDRGAGPDVPVAVCLPPGVDLVISLLAVIKAGGCYVPLDPQIPADRATFILDDAGVVLMIADSRVPGTITSGTSGRPVIRLDSDADREVISSYATSHPVDPVGEDRLGYILYTSGSTGVPKGVAVLESAVANLLRAVTRFVSLQPGDAALFTSAATFDISTVEIFLPLMSGGHVVIATRDQARTPNELVRLIDQHEVCLAQATPSAWRSLAEALAQGGRRDRLQVVTGGESLPGDLAARLCEVAGRVVNGYGPTETTIYSTMTEITRPGNDITIGRPIDGTQIYLVDQHDRLVPVGVPGEILIGGRGVARGYLNLPGTTAERFIDNPFSPDDSAVLYRSGDLARWRPDGSLHFLGRIDNQMKVRGYRIEPGEVESRLNAHPDVVASVVRAREFGPGDKRLMAFVVTADGAPTDTARLRDWCAKSLPEYMVPAIYLSLPELPLTRSGKLDEQSLPDPTQVCDDRAADHVEPRNAAERAVARTWRRALWLDEVSIHDNFFDLGGDSLIAIQVLLQLQREFVMDVPIRAIFGFPTIAELAAELVKARSTGRFEVPSSGPVDAVAEASR